MKMKMLSIILAIMIFSMPAGVVAAENCHECNEVNELTSSNTYKDVNMLDFCNYFKSKGIDVIGVKLDPNELKESYYCQYVDESGNTYFIRHSVENMKIKGKNIVINPNGFTGYALVINEDIKGLSNARSLSDDEMKNISGVTCPPCIVAIEACAANPICWAPVAAFLAGLGASAAWCVTNPSACCDKFKYEICKLTHKC